MVVVTCETHGMENCPTCHVKNAKQTRPHTCHWPGCTQQVPPAMWGCKFHWFKLPYALRRKIWAAYRPGQEERLDPSPMYLHVAKQVQEWIAQHDHPTLPRR